MSELSKFLSYVLRHAPDSIGLAVDSGGWCEVSELIAKSAAAGRTFDEAQLLSLVAASDKQRFTLSEDGRRIRAAQGHSIAVDLGLIPVEPPHLLFHGTATRFLDAIRDEGLLPGSRQKVHLSGDEATAVAVGRRHGKPVVLHVRAGEMWVAGHAFWRADNGVWLVDAVPPHFLDG
jgi:putative RNA 2'-phosphotransferase